MYYPKEAREGIAADTRLCLDNFTDDISSIMRATVIIRETHWLTAVDLKECAVNHGFSLGKDIFN